MGRRSAITEWGPAAWKFMHVVSFTYPNAPTSEDRSNAFEFMHAMARMLPCKRCREEWTAYLKEHLPSPQSHHLQSKASFSRFLVAGHNFVNDRLGKKIYSYAEAQSLYDPSFTTSLPIFTVCTKMSMIVVALIAIIIFQHITNQKRSMRDSPGLRASPLKTPGLRT